MKINQLDQDFITTDLCLANTLSMAFPLSKAERRGNRVFFCFSDTPELQLYIEQYWADKLQIEPKRFFNQLKLMKSYLYGGANG